MPKYVFQPPKGGGDPLIKRVEGQPGTLDFLLIHPYDSLTAKRCDIIYYNLARHLWHYDTFAISTGPSESQRNGLPSSGLWSFSDQDLAVVSRVTGIPIEELKEVKEIRIANLPNV